MTDAYNRTRVNLRCVLLSVLTESHRVSRMRIRAHVSVLTRRAHFVGVLATFKNQVPILQWRIRQSVESKLGRAFAHATQKWAPFLFEFFLFEISCYF